MADTSKTADLLTVGQIAARLLPIVQNPLSLQEQLRHFGKTGFLRATRSAEGAGVHALYASDEWYVAAVLITLMGGGVHPGRTRWTADMPTMIRNAIDEWKRAPGKPLFFEFILDQRAGTLMGVHDGKRDIFADAQRKLKRARPQMCRADDF